jgi:hypothetical protein
MALDRDEEKAGMVERAYALDIARKAAKAVADVLTKIEIGPTSLSAEEEMKLRDKLTDARSVWTHAMVDLRALLAEPIPAGRSGSGPLFDAPVEAHRDPKAKVTPLVGAGG